MDLSSSSSNLSKYELALRHLNNLIHIKTPDDESWETAFKKTRTYLDILGLSPEVDKLKIIHIAGTKGKGSTSAFTDSILRQCGYQTGLFTSPHLCEVTERFRINGSPIKREEFSDQFMKIYDTLQQNADVVNGLGMPGYFRFLTILGLKIFVDANLDVVVLEVGMGGRLDATNVIKKPVVCGISKIGYDHMEFLGNTLKDIAIEKAGIMKKNVACYTIQQEPEATEALTYKAISSGSHLKYVDDLHKEFITESGGPARVQLGIAGDHQYVNASLAVHLVAAFEKTEYDRQSEIDRGERIQILSRNVLPQEYVKGLKYTFWPGRCQQVTLKKDDYKKLELDVDPASESKSVKLFLDGAHTEESVLAAGTWFKQVYNYYQQYYNKLNGLAQNQQNIQTVLLFYCQPQREPQILLNTIKNLDINFDACVFTLTNSSRYKVTTDLQQTPDDESLQHLEKIGSVWKQIQLKNQENNQNQNNNSQENSVDNQEKKNLNLHQQPKVFQFPDLADSLRVLLQQHFSSQAKELHVFATGSMYLVGDILKLLKRPPSQEK